MSLVTKTLSFEDKCMEGAVASDGGIPRREISLYFPVAFRLGNEPDGSLMWDMGLLSFTGGIAADKEAMAMVDPSLLVPDEQQADSKQQPLGEGPFVLSKALPVIPAKLIRKVEKGEFVDMADLLIDNIEAERRRMSMGDLDTTGLPHASRQEVPDILSFCMYAVILPHKARELWA